MKKLLTKLIVQPIVATSALWCADLYLPGVYFQEGASIEVVVLAGIILGILNFPVKPILKILTLPLRILTLGFFSFIINIVIVFIIDLAFPELIFEGLIPMAGFIVILWIINLILTSILE